MSSPIAALLGDKVIDKTGKVISTSELASKPVLGLYFSAHWCGPCRSFTPMLAQAYSKSLHAKGLEIVFVSSDRDESAFKEYHNEMPWLALPYSDRDGKSRLASKYRVEGIPTLVFIDPASGTTISKDGRALIMGDPTGEDFPWRPKPLKDVLGTSFVTKANTSAHNVDLAGKIVGIYFSAHWCPPCRAFTPVLIDVYNKVKAAGKNFELVFVSSDTSHGEFDNYLKEMPWVAVPFEDEKRRSALGNVFGVQGIPTFVIVDYNTGKVLNKAARGAVMTDKEGVNFPWAAKSVNDLSPSNIQSINEVPAIIVFADGNDASGAEAALKSVADKHFAELDAKGEEADVAFYIGKKDPIADRVKQLMQLNDNDPVMVILDISNNAKFYSESRKLSDVTPAAVAAFFEAFRSGSLEPTPISTDDE